MTIIVIMSIVMGDDSRWTMMDFDGWMRTMKTTRLHFIDIRNHRVLAAFSIVKFSVVVAELSVFPVRNVVLEKWGFMRVSWNGGTLKSSILYDRIFHYLRTPPNRHWLLDVAQQWGKPFGRAATRLDLLYTKYIYGMMECLWCQPMIIINLPNITITYKCTTMYFIGMMSLLGSPLKLRNWGVLAHSQVTFSPLSRGIWPTPTMERPVRLLRCHRCRWQSHLRLRVLQKGHQKQGGSYSNKMGR